MNEEIKPATTESEAVACIRFVRPDWVEADLPSERQQIASGNQGVSEANRDMPLPDPRSHQCIFDVLRQLGYGWSGLARSRHKLAPKPSDLWPDRSILQFYTTCDSPPQFVVVQAHLHPPSVPDQATAGKKPQPIEGDQA